MNANNTLTRRLVVLAAFLALINATTPCFSQEEDEPQRPPRRAERRELSARQQAQLARLTAEAKRKGWTFELGYTPAVEIPLERLAGTIPPENLAEQAKAQNRRAQRALRGARMRSKAKGCNASAAKWDWRREGKVTEVQDQGACGSCWAFTTVGAFEGTYAIENNDLTDCSEQEVLSCSGIGTCNGGWWAFDHLVENGTAGEADYEYEGQDSPCREEVPTPYHAITWAYVDPDTTVPSVEDLKQALCEHGPLAVAVCATQTWSWYTGGVFNENASGSVNHGVTLIGWDDDKEAWLIKNSWGKQWGETGGFGDERGYMWIKYDTSSIGYAAAWALAAPPSENAARGKVARGQRPRRQTIGQDQPDRGTPEQVLRFEDVPEPRVLSRPARAEASIRYLHVSPEGSFFLGNASSSLFRYNGDYWANTLAYNAENDAWWTYQLVNTNGYFAFRKAATGGLYEIWLGIESSGTVAWQHFAWAGRGVPIGNLQSGNFSSAGADDCSRRNRTLHRRVSTVE